MHKIIDSVTMKIFFTASLIVFLISTTTLFAFGEIRLYNYGFTKYHINESTGNGTLGFIIETNDSGNPTVTKKTAANTGISTPDSNDRTQYVQVAHNSASSTNYSTAFIDSASGASSDKFAILLFFI